MRPQKLGHAQGHERKDELAATGMEENEEKLTQTRDEEKHGREERLGDEGRDAKGHERKDGSAAELTEECEEQLTQEREDEKSVRVETHRDEGSAIVVSVTPDYQERLYARGGCVGQVGSGDIDGFIDTCRHAEARRAHHALRCSGLSAACCAIQQLLRRAGEASRRTARRLAMHGATLGTGWAFSCRWISTGVRALSGRRRNMFAGKSRASAALEGRMSPFRKASRCDASGRVFQEDMAGRIASRRPAGGDVWAPRSLALQRPLASGRRDAVRNRS